MRVVVLGASGVLGQHMRLCVPDEIVPVFCRRHADRLHVGIDITDTEALTHLLSEERPGVIVNLAGENRTDVVEQDPLHHALVNVAAPAWLSRFCDEAEIHYIHVSSQGVFSGDNPPYGPASETEPVNEYGRQKLAAETAVRAGEHWTIVRPTFVLGVRPLPFVGRANPFEQMLADHEQVQVDDRWFSPLFARDAARQLWRIVLERPAQEIIHLGIPQRVSRFGLALMANPVAKIDPVQHDAAFPDLAQRPRDTTFALGARYGENIENGVESCQDDWAGRLELNALGRAREIALFFGRNEEECFEQLSSGFGPLHAAVAADFRAVCPDDEQALLEWYRQTEAYIWELSAYHCDPGFAYSSLCDGISERLKTAGSLRVLCLGDGIGDLTLSLYERGFEPVYHDLAGSRTAEFATFRFWMHTGEEMTSVLTEDWTPSIGQRYDAIVSLDFLEHVVNVDEWAAAIKAALRPGGLFFAQNAFAIGSGPDGSIPMHLAENDRFEHDWLPLLSSLGLEVTPDNWFLRAA